MMRPVSALRVVELSDGLPVAWCSRQFAMYGADVVCVEPQGGSALRQAAPFVGGASLTWEYVSVSKKLTTIGERPASELVGAADVLLTDWSRSRLSEAGLDVESCARRNVVVCFSDFGTTGPYASYQATDLVLQALTGSMSINGSPGREPLKTPANALAYAIGVSAFVGAVAAQWSRERTGCGRIVEVSGIDAMASLVRYMRTEYFGRPDSRSSGVGPPMLPCRGGHLFFDYASERTRPALLHVLGIDDRDVPDGSDALRVFLADRTTQRSADELFQALAGLGALAAITRTPADVLREPHLEARGFFDGVVATAIGDLPFPGPPVRMPSTSTPPRPATSFDGWSSRPDATEPRGRTSGAPLEGARVLDFTQAWLGPYATMLLADLGADVIKIEAHNRPDVWRTLGEIPPCAAPNAHKWNISHDFNGANRNKRSLTLDLKDERGRSLALDLVARSDVVMDNYRPHVMERLGLGYDVLRESNRRLVVVSVSGYGAVGPYRDYRANGPSVETIAGWVALHGYGDGHPMTTAGYPLDPLTGLHMAAAAIVGLLQANATGTGCLVEGAMIESAVGYIGEEVLLTCVATDHSPPPGNRHRGIAPHAVFPCEGEDAWVAIAVRDDADWRSLCNTVADPALDRAEYGNAAGRLAAADEIESVLSRWTQLRSPTEVMHTLQAIGVPAGVVNSTQQALDDPHLGRWFIPMHHTDVGTHRHNGFPWRFSGKTLRAALPAPRLGEHSVEILRTELGLSEEQVAELVEAGVTGSVLSYVPTSPVETR